MSENISTISVVIPYYKSEKYIGDTVQSVVDQSITVLEILIIDDECTDHSKTTLKEIEQAYGLVKIIWLERNGGAANARNIGVAHSAGEYIAFLDADDKWTPDKLKKQMDLLADYPEFAGCHTGTAVFNEDRIMGTYCNKPERLTTSDLAKSSHVCPPSLVLKREVFDQLKGFNTSFSTSEDYEFSIRLVKNGYQLGFVPEPLTMVRREGHASLSSNGMRVLKNHLRILFTHLDIFGFKGSFVFSSRAFLGAGGKVGGLLGRVLRAIGFLLFPPNIAKK